jgi:hypothetical protein
MLNKNNIVGDLVETDIGMLIQSTFVGHQSSPPTKTV